MPKKLIYTLLLLMISGIFSLSHAANIHWQNWSPRVYEQAKREHKLVLIYGKVIWCHWCQKMDGSTFTDPRVVELINDHYIPIKVDIERDSETGGRFHISEIPSLVILNSHNQELKRFYGYNSPQSILRKLTDVAQQN